MIAYVAPVTVLKVILYKSGNLYGTAELGGKYGHGTVWEITP